MRAIKTTTISILAVGLLAGPAVGVAAQEDTSDPVVPAASIGASCPEAQAFARADGLATVVRSTGSGYLSEDGYGPETISEAHGYTRQTWEQGGLWLGADQLIPGCPIVDRIEIHTKSAHRCIVGFIGR